MGSGIFHLRWSIDGGTSFHESISTTTALDLSFVDITTQLDQTAPVQFAFTVADAVMPRDTVFEVPVIATPRTV
jgi:hypothetical protein